MIPVKNRSGLNYGGSSHLGNCIGFPHLSPSEALIFMPFLLFLMQNRATQQKHDAPKVRHKARLRALKKKWRIDGGIYADGYTPPRKNFKN